MWGMWGADFASYMYVHLQAATHDASYLVTQITISPVIQFAARALREKSSFNFGPLVQSALAPGIAHAAGGLEG